jgi:hypothetical protein
MSFFARVFEHDRHTLSLASSRPSSRETLLRVRRAEADDGAVRRLALLDDTRSLRGASIVAEHAGRPVAAVEIASGRAVADPFEHTAATVARLRAEAAELRSAA